MMLTITDFIDLYGIIYMIRNKINDKRYIGQTIQDLDGRSSWSEHTILLRYQHNIHLIRSIEKYGFEKFERKRIDIAHSQEELDEKEIYWIQYYNSLVRSSGYNINKGGLGGTLSEETKKRISISLNGKMNGENNPMYNRQHSNETKKKMSESAKKKWEIKKKYISKAYLIQEYWGSEYNMENRILDPKQKSTRQIAKENKCSGSIIYNKLKEYTIPLRNKSDSIKLAKSKSKYKHSKNTKEKISENSKKMWENKEFRNKMKKEHQKSKNSNFKNLGITKKYLYEQYWVLEKSSNEIAKENKCSSHLIYNRLKWYDIQIRTRSEAAIIVRNKNKNV